uniref:WH1 domain-containing protein n=1 Tax=Panagrellus redivivus TaxID=6233 RepID=A0A7E4V018_PANRE
MNEQDKLAGPPVSENPISNDYEADVFDNNNENDSLGSAFDMPDVIDEDETAPMLEKPREDTPPVKIIHAHPPKGVRPQLYSENSYGIIAASGGLARHLTVECLVSVPAQLFLWDDALLGFLPFGNQTLCTVNLLQQITCQQTLSPGMVQPSARNSWSADHSQNNTLTAPSVAKVTPIWQYSIQCQRKSDSKTIMECNLAAHMTYICALPTFHHWRIGDRKLALSFSSDYSASKFHNRLQKALSHLSRQSKSTIAGSGESNLDATDDLDDDVFVSTDATETPSIMAKPWPRKPVPYRNYIVPICPAVSVTNHLNEQMDFYSEDDTLGKLPFISGVDEHPPMDPETARPDGGGLKLANVTPCVNCHKCCNGAGTSFLSSLSSENEPSSAGSEPKKMNLSPKSSENESFKPKLVQSSSSGHEKPSSRFKMRSIRSSSNPGSIMFVQKLSSSSSNKESSLSEGIKSKSLLETNLKAAFSSVQKEPPSANYTLRNASFELIQREKCRYCNQWYNVKDNWKGSCPDAPDIVERWIKRLTLYNFASKFVNKRMARRNQDKCANCDPSCFLTTNTIKLRRRSWYGLLSIFMPCLCCYMPLKTVYSSAAFHSLCTCCHRFQRSDNASGNTLLQGGSGRQASRHRHHRKLFPSTAKHYPVASTTHSQYLSGNKAQTAANNAANASTWSRRTVDHGGFHSQTSSAQQILNDNQYRNNPYGYITQGHSEGSDRECGHHGKSDHPKLKRSGPRALTSRLSF